MRKLFIVMMLSSLMTTTYASDTGDVKSPVSDDVLPLWFFENQGVIGISDPGLDSVQGYEQAVIRALQMYSFTETEVSAVYEIYYNIENNEVSVDDQRSHWLSEMKTVVNGYQYVVNHTFVTKYDETVVSISVVGDNSSNSVLESFASVMFYFDIDKNVNNYGERVCVECQASSENLSKLSWNSTTENELSLKTSSVNGTFSRVKNIGCNYGEGGEKDVKGCVSASLKYGLWNAYVDVFLQEFTNFESSNSTIKVSSRNITEEYTGSYGDKVQRIARMVYNTTVSAGIAGMYIEDNMLYSKWNIVENNEGDEKHSPGGRSFKYESYGQQAVVCNDKSKALNESRRSASLHANSELVIMTRSLVKKNKDNFKLDDDVRIVDTMMVSSYGNSSNIRVLKEGKPELKNNSYVTTFVKEIIVE
ncbi:MAG: hypothetical protein MJZ85_09890 [Bacteroidales bacterium]|nr:hypothetical protein [Bacteroidales bacterium]